MYYVMAIRRTNTTAGGCQCFIFVLVNWDKILLSTEKAQPPEQDF
jgi:hypothetical protein